MCMGFHLEFEICEVVTLSSITFGTIRDKIESATVTFVGCIILLARNSERVNIAPHGFSHISTRFDPQQVPRRKVLKKTF